MSERKKFQDPSGNFRLDQISGVVNNGLLTCAMHCVNVPVDRRKKREKKREKIDIGD